MIYYAHSTPSDKTQWQTVKTHLENTADLTRTLSRDSNLSEFAYLAALLHDIGKYSLAFQKRLEGAASKVDHSTAGAQELIHIFDQSNAVQKIIGTLLSYCISGHHGGLLDFGSDLDLESDGTLKARFKKQIDDYAAYKNEIELPKLPTLIPIKPIPSHVGFSLAFFTRMVYSLLVDADFIETETFMQQTLKPRGGYTSLQDLWEVYKQFLTQFDKPIGPINKKRTDILTSCLSRADEPPGLFTLTVPTGGGKTFISLAFALNHAVTHGMERIIYVIPYTSIIEQNAGRFKECLGNENVLEHHSNFDWNQNRHPVNPEDNDDSTNNTLQKLKLASENWDIPIVVTTNVQFFESIFANRSSRCRKLHNIANSVIIFDEAQMLPRDFMKPCMLAVHELVKNYKASAIFCTATQPALEQFLPGPDRPRELISDPAALYNFYKRVGVKFEGSLSDESLLQQINRHPQALCIVNTRKHAAGLFEGVASEGRYHLSTLMCPQHRRETITTLRQRLKDGQPCRVISTQIMEAGIDVDFPVGFRALAGLDSIIQAAGRVNREGKNAVGCLHVFEPDSNFIKRTPAYIQQTADVARKVLRDFKDKDPISLEAIQAYYHGLYDLQDKNAFDSHGIIACFEKGIPANFDFKTAAEKFRLIEDNSVSVIIPYNLEAITILYHLQASEYPNSFFRRLQPFTVNIYERELQALQAQGLIDFYHETFAVLNNLDYYNPGTGLLIPENNRGEALFFDG